MLFCIINDFHAYENLSGYSVKGYKACPIYEENTSYEQLKHGRKTIYLQHCRFLNLFHPYRRLKKAFNGNQEHEISSIPLIGAHAYDKVKGLHVDFEKKKERQV